MALALRSRVWWMARASRCGRLLAKKQPTLSEVEGFRDISTRTVRSGGSN